MDYNGKKMVVAIPCYNEEKTIKKVINDFKNELPTAEIVIFDNNSTDNSARIAKGEGAEVIDERRQGKGWVVKSIFEKIEADIYILVDADDTYLAEDVHRLIEPVLDEEADMAVGCRLGRAQDKAFRGLHIFGNYWLTFLLNKLFRANFKDILSGYRVFSCNFVEHVPLITGGFQTEAEMTIQAVEKNMRILEVPIGYRPRPQGSLSKINTFRDGWLILLTMAMYMRDHNPLRFFLYLAILWICGVELLFGVGLLGRLSSNEILITQMVIFLGALLLFVGGLVISAVNTRFKEFDITVRKLVRKDNSFNRR